MKERDPETNEKQCEEGPTHILTAGAVWERYRSVEIVEGAEVDHVDEEPIECPHAKKIYDGEYKVPHHHDLPGTHCPAECPGYHVVRQAIYRYPSVVVACNEGGYASTGVCLLCIVEEARRLGILTGEASAWTYLAERGR